jgi:molecular chaperone GrpE
MENEKQKETEAHTEKEKQTDKQESAQKTKKRTTAVKNEIKKLKEENTQLKDQLLRKMAEFDNYRKRTEREYLDRVRNAGERLIVELLPVIDDMERSLDHAREGNDLKSLIAGSELIYKKFLAILEKEGLKPLTAVGEEFDPEKHDALLQTESDKHESGTVVDEHLKGYELNGKVIRHAQVIVAR